MTCNEGTVSVLKFRSSSRFDDLCRDITYDKSDYFVRITGLNSDQCPAFNNGRFCSNGLYHSVDAKIYDKICLNFRRFVIVSLRDTLPSL